MSNETESTQQAAPETEPSAAPKSAAGQELVDELTKLGQRFIDVVEVAWNSEERKRAQEDLRTGLVSLAHSLEDGVKRVSSTKEAQNLVDAAEDVAEKVRTSKVAAEVSSALTQGLRALSEQLEKLAQEMQQKKAAGDGTPPAEGSQDIPIARDDKA